MTGPEELIEAHGLSFKSHEVGENPYMPQDSSDLRHWLCSVDGDGIDRFEFYISAGEDACPGAPGAAFALSLVMDDVRAFRECAGYADFARLIGVDDEDPSGAVAWNEVSRLAGIIEPLAQAALSLSVPG